MPPFHDPTQTAASAFRAMVFLVACALGLGGCATKVTGPQSGYFLVSSPLAEFYKYGPAQSFGPDFTLKKGDKVLMLEKSWGFCRVMTDGGISGFISSDDIVPAPPEPAAVKKAPTGGSGGGRTFFGRPKRSNVEPVPSDPLFNVNDVPLPLPDEPTKPKPKFRSGPVAPRQQPSEAPKLR